MQNVGPHRKCRPEEEAEEIADSLGLNHFCYIAAPPSEKKDEEDASNTKLHTGLASASSSCSCSSCSSADQEEEPPPFPIHFDPCVGRFVETPPWRSPWALGTRAADLAAEMDRFHWEQRPRTMRGVGADVIIPEESPITIEDINAVVRELRDRPLEEEEDESPPPLHDLNRQLREQYQETQGQMADLLRLGGVRQENASRARALGRALEQPVTDAYASMSRSHGGWSMPEAYRGINDDPPPLAQLAERIAQVGAYNDLVASLPPPREGDIVRQSLLSMYNADTDTIQQTELGWDNDSWYTENLLPWSEADVVGMAEEVDEMHIRHVASAAL